MKRPGFTLIELIAVIVVIIVLAAIALPRIGNMRVKAAKSGDQASLVVIAGALDRAITDGVLTTNNESLSATVITQSNSFAHVPYIQYPMDNVNIARTNNWPGFDITITNPIYGTATYHLNSGGGFTFVDQPSNNGGSGNNGGGNNGGGNTNGGGGNLSYTLNYATDGNGELSYNSSLVWTVLQTVTAGGNGGLVTAVPSSGYVFSSWSDGYPTASRTDSSIQTDVSVTALFSVDPSSGAACSANDALDASLAALFNNTYLNANVVCNPPIAPVSDPANVVHQFIILFETSVGWGGWNPNINDGVPGEWAYKAYDDGGYPFVASGTFPYLNDDGSVPDAGNDPQGLFAAGLVTFVSPCKAWPLPSDVQALLQPLIPPGTTLNVYDGGGKYFQFTLTTGGHVCGPYTLGPPMGS